jgi:hypothetical protein
VTELYLLEWKDQQPTAAQVMSWLAQQGFVIDGTPKVYPNGTIMVECEPDPTNRWQDFTASPQTPADTMAHHVSEVVRARAELLAIPEPERNATQRALLAIIELVMYGFGVGHG